jgi:hypothetical protein
MLRGTIGSGGIGGSGGLLAAALVFTAVAFMSFGGVVPGDAREFGYMPEMAAIARDLTDALPSGSSEDLVRIVRGFSLLCYRVIGREPAAPAEDPAKATRVVRDAAADVAEIKLVRNQAIEAIADAAQAATNDDDARVIAACGEAFQTESRRCLRLAADAAAAATAAAGLQDGSYNGRVAPFPPAGAPWPL